MPIRKLEKKPSTGAYTVVVLVQTTTGTYNKTLLFESQEAADRAQATIATQIDDTWGD